MKVKNKLGKILLLSKVFSFVCSKPLSALLTMIDFKVDFVTNEELNSVLDLIDENFEILDAIMVKLNDISLNFATISMKQIKSILEKNKRKKNPNFQLRREVSKRKRIFEQQLNLLETFSRNIDGLLTENGNPNKKMSFKLHIKYILAERRRIENNSITQLYYEFLREEKDVLIRICAIVFFTNEGLQIIERLLDRKDLIFTMDDTHELILFDFLYQLDDLLNQSKNLSRTFELTFNADEEELKCEPITFGYFPE